MNFWTFTIFALFFLVFSPKGYTSESIVPKRERISNFETKFTLATLLSHHTDTREKALQLFEEMLNEKSHADPHIDHFDQTKSLPNEKEPSEKYITLVPENNWILNFDVKLALARIYSHQEETQKLALKIYIALHQEKPENIEVSIELGRLYITLKKFREGLDLFYQTLAMYPNDIKLLVAAAQAEVASGHAEEARSLFLKALDLSGEKDSILVDYADGMMMWGDYYKSEEIYRYALQHESCSLDLFLKLAWSLASQQRYEEAEGIYRSLLIKWPNEQKILDPLSNLKVLEKDFNEALELVNILLELQPSSPKYLQSKAEILLKKRLFCEAIDTFNEFVNDHKLGSYAYVGLGKAYLKMIRNDEARKAFQEAYDIDQNNIEAQYYLAEDQVLDECFIENLYSQTPQPYELNEWANVYIQNGMPDKALILYELALKIDPKYFPAKIGMSETLSTLYFYSCSIEIYENLLQTFPENYKLMLSLARVYAWSKNYETAFAKYDDIINLNSNNPVPYKEKARTAFWAKEIDLSMVTYDELLQRPVDNFSDYLIHTSILLEKHAKKLNWDKRYICAVKAYKELLAFNPGNEEALFDYAQVYCSLGLCDCSSKIYENILNINPNHTLVQKALYRNQLRKHFGVQGNFTYWREIGTGSFSASQIARYRLDEVFEIPLSCRSHLRFSQQEYVENPFYNFKFYPAEGQTIETDFIYNEHLTGFFNASYKNYFGEFSSTITCHNKIVFTPNDYLQIFLSCNKEDEIYNYFSLKQAIQAIISQVTVLSKLSRHWNASGTCQYYRYNDNNSQIHFNLLTEYEFAEYPNAFKLILQGDYRNTAHQSISILVGTQLVDMIHPYWTPDKYFDVALTLEYAHDYRPFSYCEAPERFIDIKITVGTDNVNNPSIEGILEWKHEWDRHWGFDVKGYIHRSPLWNAEGAWGTLSYRF